MCRQQDFKGGVSLGEVPDVVEEFWGRILGRFQGRALRKGCAAWEVFFTGGLCHLEDII